MDAIQRLLEELKKYPGLRYEAGTDRGYPFVRIEAPDEQGFPIALEDGGDEWTVYYGSGCHYHFDEAEEALNLVALALSEGARLVEVWRGQLFQTGKLQRWTGDGWRTAYTSGLLLWPFWRRKRIVILQNRVIKNETGVVS